MSRLALFIILLSAVVAAMAGCTPAETTTAELPTRASLPTNTPTATPTDTDVPSPTPTVTASNTPTPTTTSTPTVTPTSTLTFTPSNTPTPTNTSTPTVTPTATATDTPPPTNTPTQPTIRVFQANIEQGDPGDPVRLRWDADADTVRLERVNEAGAVVETIPAQPLGAVSLTLPTTEAASVVYRLVAVRGPNEQFSSLSIQIGSQCDIEWFFNAPTDIGCPSSANQTVQLLFQQLERGFMFRLTTGAIDQVCAVHSNRNNIYVCYPPATFTGTPPATPPDGLMVPATDLLSAFYTQLGLEGLVYQSLGWATAMPFTNNTVIQFSEDNFLYLLTPVGVYRFDATLSQDFVQSVRVADG